MKELLTLSRIQSDAEVEAIMLMSSKQLDALSFTEHSKRHASIVSKWAGDVLRALNASPDRVRLAEIAGYLHDIGNCVNRVDHAQSGALLAYQILVRMGMDYADAAEIMTAIGNHDEHHGLPVSDISAAIILADKSDVHKSRVRNPKMEHVLDDIHDRVNLAAERSFLTVQDGVISLNIQINTKICPVMDYFEIYFKRMQLCRRAAEFLGGKFSLVINDTVLL